MSTSSTISIQKHDETVVSIHCQSDGYLARNGKLLLRNYTTYEEVEALIALGNLSALDIDIDSTLAYSRDMNESLKIFESYSDLEAYKIDNNGTNYDYIFIDEVWYIRSDDQLVKLEIKE